MRNKITHLFDETLRVCEDNIFLLTYCLGIRTAFYLEKDYYHIFERSNSVTRGGCFDWKEILLAREKMITIAQEAGNVAKGAAERDYLDQCIWVIHQQEKELKTVQEIKKIYRRYVKNHIKQIVTNSSMSWQQKYNCFQTYLL